MTRGRLVGLLVLVAGLSFGFFGGEFSTLDWLQLRRQTQDEQAAIEQLQRDIDSLAAYADSISGDAVTQERVAREKFGMMRNGEMLYRVGADTTLGRVP